MVTNTCVVVVTRCTLRSDHVSMIIGRLVVALRYDHVSMIIGRLVVGHVSMSVVIPTCGGHVSMSIVIVLTLRTYVSRGYNCDQDITCIEVVGY